MTRILAVSRVVVSDGFRVRFLCIRKSVDTNKARLMMTKVPYPCYNIYDVASLFNSDDLYFIDYSLSNNEQLSSIPYSQGVARLKCSRLTNKDSLLELLCTYNPLLIKQDYYVLYSYFRYFSSGWILFNNTPLCIWKQSFKDKNVLKHFSINEDILIYSFEKDIYILTDENVRHKPAKIGEVLSINIKSLDCIKYIRSINSESQYKESTYIFDRTLRDWVLFKDSEPLTVLGRKDR